VRPKPVQVRAPGARVVRVLPVAAAIDKEFDYLVADDLAASIRVGTVVRVDLAGRRVAAWVVDTWVVGGERVSAHAEESERALRPLALVTGWGPEPELLDLAAWAAWRWAGRRSSLLNTANAEGRVRTLPLTALTPPAAPPVELIPAELLSALGEFSAASERDVSWGGATAPASAALLTPRAAGEASPLVFRLPPAADPTPIIAHLAQRGPTLVVVPALSRAGVLADRLRRAGAGVAALPGEWAQARAGAGVVIGARAAAWAPCPGLAAVVVVDGHDESLVQEQAPTWSAVDVAAERARRAGVPCVVISPCPPVELLADAHLVRVTPDAERSGWSVLDVVDRRGDDPRLGLYSRAGVDAVRSGGTVLCVLNRVGRTRLLACAACGTVADCERCAAAVGSAVDGELSCPRCGLTRPVVCRSCHSTRLRQLRVGVSRAREELEALAGRPVGEVTASGVVNGDADVLVGTEAVLHHATRADAVVFLDFDQHLLAPRLRAHQEAIGLLARASRLAGGRRARAERPPGRVVVQTRLPDHPVLAAVAVADPGRLVDHEMEIRRQLRFPPVTALAAVSGPAAAALIERLRSAAGGMVEVLGPDDGRWLVRAADSASLADALAAVARPAGRLRVEVDPQRI
jgi:primosomal protein N' (replication factor Y) (superfamily II helicase)